MVGTEIQQRARRYAMATPLLFRQCGDQDWRPAWTLNLSRTGVLFRADDPPPALNREIEFIFTLPVPGASSGPQVRCLGRVVRVANEGLSGFGRVVAMTIDDYAFLGRLPARGGQDGDPAPS